MTYPVHYNRIYICNSMYSDFKLGITFVLDFNAKKWKAVYKTI